MLHTSSKRKHQILTLAQKSQKLELLMELENGVSGIIMKDYDIVFSTMYDIKKQRQIETIC